MENNQENLSGSQAATKIKELATKTGTCFFNTSTTAGKMSSRPMAHVHVDDDGCIWFMTSKNSKKIQEINADSAVDLYYSDTAGSHYMSLTGSAAVNEDHARIKEYYTPLLNNWFDGAEDPNIALIKISPSEGFYWDTKNSRIIQGVKMLVGAVTGKTSDDSIEGNLSL